MGTKTIPLTANKTERLPYAGQMLQLVDLGVATSLQVGIEWKGQQDLEDYGVVDNRFRVFSEKDKFSGFELTSTVNTTVTVIVSYRDVKISDTENATVSIDPTTLPIATQETTAAVVTDSAAVAMTAVVAQIIAAGTRKELRLANIGTDAVTIGAAGMTWAKRVIVLNPGDVWIETRSPHLAWYGICDAAKTASVTVQVLT